MLSRRARRRPSTCVIAVVIKQMDRKVSQRRMIDLSRVPLSQFFFPSLCIYMRCAYSDVEPRDLHLPAPRDLQLLEHDAVELGLLMY